MSVTWAAGDIGAETNGSFLARLIQFGQRLRRDKNWRWNHIFVVVDDAGNTVEALGKGVARDNVGARTVLNLGCPAGVDRSKVVAFALSKLGTPYSYFGVTLMGVDCLLGTTLHTHDGGPLFCSELGSEALRAGGWVPPKDPAEIKPGDLVDLLSRGRSS